MAKENELYLSSLKDKELLGKGIELLAQGILAIRQLSSENFNRKVKEDYIFLLSDSIHKLPYLCLAESAQELGKEYRTLLENEIKLVIKAIEKYNMKFPHKSISHQPD